MYFFLIFILLNMLSTSLYSNENIIIADRPGFSTGTYTVQPKTLNVEFGYNYTLSKDIDTQTLPLLVLRTGATQDIELNFICDGLELQSQGNQKTSISNITLGGKYRIYKNDIYNLTLMGLITLPTSNNSQSNTISPLIGILWDYSLIDDASLFGTIQTSRYEENKEYINDIQIALGTSVSHTKKISSFIEIYTILPLQKNINTEATIDGGFTYLLNNDIQFDINFGMGLNSYSDDFIGCGIALQFY